MEKNKTKGSESVISDCDEWENDSLKLPCLILALVFSFLLILTPSLDLLLIRRL